MHWIQGDRSTYIFSQDSSEIFQSTIQKKKPLNKRYRKSVFKRDRDKWILQIITSEVPITYKIGYTLPVIRTKYIATGN